MTSYRLKTTIKYLEGVVRMEEKELLDHRKAILRTAQRIRDFTSRISVLRRQLSKPFVPGPKIGKVEYVRSILQANGCEYYFDKKKTMYSLKIVHAPKEVLAEVRKTCDGVKKFESLSRYYQMTKHFHPNRPKEMVTRYIFRRPA
jgi:hypothetical protein